MESKVLPSDEKKRPIKKALSFMGNIIVFLILIFAIFILSISVMAKKDSDGAATIFGYQLRFVQSSSMEKCDQTDVSEYKIKSIPVKSCVFIEVMPKEEAKQQKWLETLRIGDVLTFKYVYQKQVTITHRVVKIEEKNQGGYIITLEGDNKLDSSGVGQQIIDTSDENSPNYIIGRVTGQSRFVGSIVYALRSPIGIICIIIIPFLTLIGFQIIRIIGVLNKEKKEKEAIAWESQANEIKELRRQLDELQQKSNKSTAPPISDLPQEGSSLSKDEEKK